MPTIDERDYEAAETLLVSDPAKLRAMADPFRVQLVQLLRDKARPAVPDMWNAYGEG